MQYIIHSSKQTTQREKMDNDEFLTTSAAREVLNEYVINDISNDANPLIEGVESAVYHGEMSLYDFGLSAADIGWLLLNARDEVVIKLVHYIRERVYDEAEARGYLELEPETRHWLELAKEDAEGHKFESKR
jgi:hypothetical protein